MDADYVKHRLVLFLKTFPQVSQRDGTLFMWQLMLDLFLKTFPHSVGSSLTPPSPVNSRINITKRFLYYCPLQWIALKWATIGSCVGYIVKLPWVSFPIMSCLMWNEVVFWLKILSTFVTSIPDHCMCCVNVFFHVIFMLEIILAFVTSMSHHCMSCVNVRLQVTFSRKLCLTY